MDKQTELHRIQQEFTDLADLLAAIGDETRQYLIQAMFEFPCEQEGGTRVGAITEKTHLSRLPYQIFKTRKPIQFRLPRFVYLSSFSFFSTFGLGFKKRSISTSSFFSFKSFGKTINSSNFFSKKSSF